MAVGIGSRVVVVIGTRGVVVVGAVGVGLVGEVVADVVCGIGAATVESRGEPLTTNSASTNPATTTTRTPPSIATTPAPLPVPTISPQPTESMEPSDSEMPAPVPAGAEMVVYTVSGEGRAINITYVDTGGIMQTEFNVALPWSKQVSLAAPARNSASVAVVNVGRDVTCSVSVNGAQVRQRTGQGLTICTGVA